MKKKILVVDDERSIVKLLSLRLRAQNYEVIKAYDGYQCIEAAKTELPDLILLDIKMPNGGGIKAFENMQNIKETKNIPVIFITAFPKPEVKELVLKMGASGFITKPFDGELLKAKIKKVLQEDDTIDENSVKNKIDLFYQGKSNFNLEY